jgi:SPP1 family predicted phage head-tail adaptor
MDAGELDQRITIETRTLTQDALGADVENWSEHSRPAAKVIETPGREFLKGEVQGEKRAVFVIYWRALDSTSRVTWRGRIYTIEDITGTQREGYAWLHCKSVSGAN